jgi:hypothetical protein
MLMEGTLRHLRITVISAVMLLIVADHYCGSGGAVASLVFTIEDTSQKTLVLIFTIMTD